MDAIKDFLTPSVVWFIVGIVLLTLELAMPGIIIAFFGAGACLVAIICLFVDISLNTQLVIFIVSSIVLLACLRRFLRGIFLGHVDNKSDLSENAQEFIGEHAAAKTDITAGGSGKVELHGTDWTAESQDAVKKGDKVEITGKTNLVLKVKKIN